MMNTMTDNYFKDKNILVTGGTGFIGANLVDRLLSLGANVRSIIHQRDIVVDNDRVEYVKCNLLDMKDCKKIPKDIDIVFHCAAVTHGAAIITSDPLSIVTPNIIMNAQMLYAAYRSGVKKFVFISSSAAYPPTGIRHTKEEEMFIDDPHDSYFGVGWMKRYSEILCRLYSEKLRLMKTVVIRPGNVYGPFDNFNLSTSHVMSATIRKVIERKNPTEVWGIGNDIRDFIYIDDFIDGLLLATEKIDGYEYNPINIASGKGYTVSEILKMAIEIDGADDIEIIYNKDKPSTIPMRLIDTSKAEKLLGFKAKVDIKEGIKKTIDWYKENLYNRDI